MSMTMQDPGSRVKGHEYRMAARVMLSGIDDIVPQPVSLPHGVPSDKVPRHVAIICDGNARWAQARGLSVAEGHERGAALLVPMAEAATDWGIAAVTGFILSTENFQREESELQYLFALLGRRFLQDLPQLLSLGVKIQFMSQRDRLPPTTQQLMATLESATAHNNRLLLNIAAAYGGQQDIVSAAQALARKVQQGLLQPEQISEALLSQHLASAAVGAPDFLVRTSGEQRLSNFMLWESAYTELYFSNLMWPDFNRHELEKALQHYATRKRRFGAREFTCDAKVGAAQPMADNCVMPAANSAKAGLDVVSIQ